MHLLASTEVAAEQPICRACGTQFGATPPPEVCPICADERQAVPDDGQGWTTLAALGERHHNVFTAHEPVLTSLRTEQRATCCGTA